MGNTVKWPRKSNNPDPKRDITKYCELHGDHENSNRQWFFHQCHLPQRLERDEHRRGSHPPSLHSPGRIQRPTKVYIGGHHSPRPCPPPYSNYSLLQRHLRSRTNLETNDIFTKKDGEFLVKHGALPEERIHAVEIGVCPHGRILEDININLGPLEELCNLFKVDILLYDSGGDVSSGDKTPRKGGPGITQANLLVINKTDLAPIVGVDLGIMERDALCIRDGSSFFLLKFHGQGVEEFTGIGSCNQEIVTIILLKVLILCIGLFIYLFLFQLFLRDVKLSSLCFSFCLHRSKQGSF
ncbi:hypothetical protein UlMin_011630 [Ulmus minor]